MRKLLTENLRHSLRRLDQFAKDGKVTTTPPTTTNFVGEPLTNLLTEWKQSYLSSINNKDEKHGRAQEQPTVVSPAEIVMKLDEWKSDSPYVQPDSRCYEFVLDTVAEASSSSSSSSSSWPYSRSQRELSDLYFANDLLQRLVDECQTGDNDFPPTSSSFVKVMNAWSQSTQKASRITQQHQQQKSRKMKPTLNDRYNQGVNNDHRHDLPSSSSMDSPSTIIQRWIDTMHELHKDGWQDVEPTVVMYNVLLNALAQSGDVDQMELVLSQMIQGDEIVGISPDTVSFTTLLKAYNNIGTKVAAQKAESLLFQMEELYDNGIQSVKPNTVTYTTVMNCYLKSGDHDAGEKAEAILRRLEKRWRMNTTDLNLYSDATDARPDVQAYNSVLSAYAKTNQPEKAEQLLLSMMSTDNDNDDNDNNYKPEPNSVSFNIVMSAWARYGDYERAEAILMEMHELSVEYNLSTRPDVISYNTVLDALGKASKKSTDKKDLQQLAERGEQIISHMERLYKESGDEKVRPNTVTWNTCINICAKAGMIDEANELLERFTAVSQSTTKDDSSRFSDDGPNVNTHNTLLSACMIRGQIALAMTFWRRMKDLGIQSDVVTYNTILKCHVRALRRKNPVNKKRTVKSAHDVMRQMKQNENIQPDHITYSAMVDIFLLNDGIEQAQNYMFEVIKESTDKYGGGYSVPSREIFHRILTSWIPKRTPRRAEKLLHRMADASRQYRVDLQPNIQTYNLLLQCWSESCDPTAGERTEKILYFMDESLEDITPDLDSYIHVLSSWKNSGDLTALIRIDSLILKLALNQDPKLQPNEDCYNIWLDAISESNVVVDKRQKVQDVLSMMQIHSFQMTDQLQQKIDVLKVTSSGKG